MRNELNEVRQATNSERSAANNLRRTFQAAESHTRRIEEKAAMGQPECQARCAKLENQLEALRQELHVARAAAEDAAQASADLGNELREARERIDRLQRAVATWEDSYGVGGGSFRAATLDLRLDIQEAVGAARPEPRKHPPPMRTS